MLAKKFVKGPSGNKLSGLTVWKAPQLSVLQPIVLEWVTSQKNQCFSLQLYEHHLDAMNAKWTIQDSKRQVLVTHKKWINED